MVRAKGKTHTVSLAGMTLALVLYGAPYSGPFAGNSQELRHWRHHFMTSAGQDTVWILPESWSFPGIVRVFDSDSSELSPFSYVMAEDPFRLLFQTAPDSGTYILYFFPLKIDLRSTYRRWVTVDSSDIPAESPGTRRPVRDPPVSAAFADQLDKSGSIFRGLTVGSDGMRLQSGLRMQVSGFIAPQVEVTASLTDQNTPIQPEGNTQTLQEIDKIFVNISTPWFQSTMGDLVLDMQPFALGSYTRKLEGAVGTLRIPAGEVTVSAAVSKGQFNSSQFMGQEANQGPYQLTGSLGQREIIVLAGTEKVWVDGEIMRRGEDNDYIIEYGNGQLTFTRHRLITADSRITVDFEYSDQMYQKEIFTASSELKLLNDRLRIRTAYLREADDKDNPLNMELTEEYRNILAQSGDNPDSAIVSGIRYMGPGKGNYTRVDSADIVFYRYTGQDSGEYRVQFSYAGAGKGTYRFKGYGYFEYVGEGGDYLPVIYLPLPERHQAALTAVSLNLGRLQVETELGVSDKDQNMFSRLDDHDNTDIAYNGKISLNEQPLRWGETALGHLTLGADFRHIGDHYRALGRVAEVEHGRKWGIREGDFWGETVNEFHALYIPAEQIELSGELGRLSKQNTLEARRMAFETRVQKAKWPLAQYRIERIQTKADTGNTEWIRHRGRAEVRIGRWTPLILYQGEDRRLDGGDRGFNYDEWTGGVQYERGPFQTKISRQIRDDRRYQGGGLRPASSARTDRLDLSFQGGPLTSSLTFTRRRREYSNPDLNDQTTSLADWVLRYAPSRRFVEASLNYRFSSTQMSGLVRDTIRVGPGLGNYRYDEDLQEYVPDEDGDVIFRTLQTGEFTPVNDCQLGGEFRFWGDPIFSDRTRLTGILKQIKTRTLIRLERQDRTEDFLAVNQSLFNPEWGKDSTTVLGRISWIHDVEYSPPRSRLSVRFRWKRDDSENYQMTGEGLMRRSKETGLRLKTSLSRQTGVLMEYTFRADEKNYVSGTLSDRNIQSHEWKMEGSYRLRQNLELALQTRVQGARDETPDPVTDATALFFAPRVTASFMGRGQCRAEWEWGMIKSEPYGRSLPYEMFSGDQPGKTWRWTVLMSYRISGHVIASLNYRGRREPWRQRTFQSGQVEIRAFF
ncbi:MAG TPA: hypothetical protein ENN03_01250 [bacterium]|nr:hypothetical protein [bacterium]